MDGGEKELLERAKNGEIEAFEKLVEGYQKKVFNIALRLIGSHDDASEAAQEVFVKVFKSINKFKGEAAFSTWIYSITRNVCMDELRKKKNKNVVSLDEEIKLPDGDVKREVEDDKPTPEVITEKNELRAVVRKAILSLSEDHKTMIVLRDLQGMSYEEISKVFKCPEGTVKSRINRARQALKEKLKDYRELFSEYYVK